MKRADPIMVKPNVQELLDDVITRPRPSIKKMKVPYRVLYTYRIIDKKDPNKFLTEFVQRASIVETDQSLAHSETLVKDLNRVLYDRIDMEYFSQKVNLSSKTNGSSPAFDIELRLLKYDRLHPKVIKFQEVDTPFYSVRQEALVPA